MTTRILIIGGYGNFGRFIARRLSREPDIRVIIAGRSAEKAKAFAETLKAELTAIDVPAALDWRSHLCGPISWSTHRGRSRDKAMRWRKPVSATTAIISI